MSEKIGQLKLVAPDGKLRLTDVAESLGADKVIVYTKDYFTLNAINVSPCRI